MRYLSALDMSEENTFIRRSSVLNAADHSVVKTSVINSVKVSQDRPVTRKGSK